MTACTDGAENPTSAESQQCAEPCGDDAVCYDGVCLARASSSCAYPGSVAECERGSRCWELDDVGAVCLLDNASAAGTVASPASGTTVRPTTAGARARVPRDVVAQSPSSGLPSLRENQLRDAIVMDDPEVALAGPCAPGSSIREFRPDGSVLCEVDDDSGGDITGITTPATSGLVGGCDGGTCTLGLMSCGPDQLLQATGSGYRCTDAPRVGGLQMSGTIERALGPNALDNGTLFRMTSRVQPSLAAWTLGAVEGYFDVPYQYLDKTLQLGYNYDGAVRQNPDEPAVFLQFEHSYQAGDQVGSNQRVTELHLSGQDLAGVEHRYFSNMSAWDGSWGLTMVTGTVLKFSDWSYNLFAKISREGFVSLVPLAIQSDATTPLRITSEDNSTLFAELARSGSYIGSPLIVEASSANVLDLRNRVGDAALRMFASSGREAASITMGSDGRWNFIHDGLPMPDARMQFLYNTGGVFFIDANGTTALQLAHGGTVIAQKVIEAWNGMRLPSTQPLRWSSTAYASETADVGLGRRAPGLLEVTNGTPGALRDLAVRHVVAAGPSGGLDCGAGPQRSGDDTAGTITAGSGATTCTITFASEFAKTPTCVVSSPSGKPLSYSKTRQQLTVTSPELGDTTFDYICMGH